MPLLDEKLVAPAAGIGPGLRAVEDNRPVGAHRRLQPQRHGKRLAATEVAHRRLHRMIAGELERLTKVPRDNRDLCRARRRGATVNRIGEGIVGAPAIEGKGGDPSGECRGVGGGQFQGHVSLASHPRQHLRTRDPFAAVELRRRQAASFVGLLHRRLPGIIGQP